MPLDSALTMLRDKNNNVNLDMDVSGNVDDAKFSLTDAINQALTKALRLRLDPAPYLPGEATPSPSTRDYLEKVGRLLQERADLRLKLCGMAVPRDKLSGTRRRDRVSISLCKAAA